jgi:RNA polymerase sigma-70 factor (ECF subfamily)
MTSNSKDSILVKNYLNGEEKSLEILIYKHQERIYNFIYSKVLDKDLSNDIFQDTFIKVIRNLRKGKYNEEGKFLPWIMRIAHNLIIDHFRKCNRMPKFQSKDKDFDILTFIKDSSNNAEKQIILDQVATDVKALINKLPSDQKQVVEMRLFKDMSFKEIAENSNTSINTALGRMRYAIINLRKLIKKHNIILIE